VSDRYVPVNRPYVPDETLNWVVTKRQNSANVELNANRKIFLLNLEVEFVALFSHKVLSG
jgi:hypothetical protein